MRLDKIIAVRTDKTVYRDGDNCVKVFGADFSKADVLNEALNQARVEETGLCIPKIKEVTTFDGKWAIVSQYISGKTPARLMKENPEKKAEYLELLVDLQLEIQAKTCPLLNKLKDKLNRKIFEANVNAAVRHNLHTRLLSMPEQNKLCHGDFGPSNVIITDDGTPYILDWSHATQGDAAADAASTALRFRLTNDREEEDIYISLFCSKSGIEKSHLQKWMPIMAASRSVKSNEAERQLLLSFVDVTD